MRTSRSPVNYASKVKRRVVEPCRGPVRLGAGPRQWVVPCRARFTARPGTCTRRSRACWTRIVSSDAIPPTTSMPTVTASPPASSLTTPINYSMLPGSVSTRRLIRSVPDSQPPSPSQTPCATSMPTASSMALHRDLVRRKWTCVDLRTGPEATTTSDRSRDRRPGPASRPREPTMGMHPHPRRAAQAGHPGGGARRSGRSCEKAGLGPAPRRMGPPGRSSCGRTPRGSSRATSSAWRRPVSRPSTS